MPSAVKIGIIGGSGLSNPDLLSDASVKPVSTSFGLPSDGQLIEGKIDGVPCVILARHGKKHSIMPTAVNYRANLLALKNLGCTHVLVSTACGSLKEEIEPGHFVILDQFIDRTSKRATTFYDASSDDFQGILHLPMDRPFCEQTRKILISCCQSLDYKFHPKGTVITIEGPRFSSRAESNMFRQWGADVINMTTVPEVVLARELGLCYAAIAMATDYDCWKEDNVVSVSSVMATMKENAERAKVLLRKAVLEIAKQDWTDAIANLKDEVKNSTMLPS